MMEQKQKPQTVLAQWAKEQEAQRLADIERNEPPQGIDSEESMTVTEADIEEARQALRQQKRRAYGMKYRARKRRAQQKKSGGQPGTRKRPAAPPVYYSLDGKPTVVEQGVTGEIGTVIEEEIRQVYAEIADLQRQVEIKQSYITLLITGSKRMGQKAKPTYPTVKEVNDAEAANPTEVAKPGTMTADAIHALRRVGRPLYIAELAREMGIHSKTKRATLLGTISPNASKGKFGLIRVGPSVFALAEWGEPK